MVGIGNKAGKTNHSPLMEALTKAGEGNIVNFCPFGCGDHELDENGYCYHLVGFTLPQPGLDMKVYEQMGFHPSSGRRIINSGTDGAGKEIDGELRRVEEADKLERVTGSCRVYRKNAPKPVKKRDLAQDILAEESEYKEIEAEEKGLAALGMKV